MPLVYSSKRVALTAPKKYSTGINPGITEIKEAYLASALAQGCKLVKENGEVEPAVAEVDEEAATSRKEQVFAAVKTLVTLGEKENFTNQGIPRVNAVVDIVGFDVKAKECADALDLVMAEA